MADDYGNSYSDANVPSVTPGSSIGGTIELSGDTDAFRFSLVRGMTYMFTLGAGQTGPSLSDFTLYLRDAAGGYVTYDYGSNASDPASIQFTANATGNFFLYATGSSGQTGTYRLNSSAGVADDYADDFNDSGGYGNVVGSLSPGASKGGSVETLGDVDAFRISLVKGMTYTFTLGAGQTGASLSDFTLYLRDAAGGYVTYDYGSNASDPASIQFTANATGDFFLYAQSGGSGGNRTGTYTIAASGGTGDDYADDFNDSGGYGNAVGALSPNGSLTGSVETLGDVDAFKVRLVQGTTYTFTLGAGQAGASLSDFTLYLRDAAGGYVTYDYGSNASDPASIQFTANATGNFFLYAQSGGSGGRTGTYTIAASGGTGDDYADDFNDSAGTGDVVGSLARGGQVTGSIETTGDVDAFAITLTQGQSYTFRLGQGATGTSLTDFTLYLRDNAGGYITYDYGASTSDPAAITVTAGYSGTHYLYAAPSTAGKLGRYTLTATGGTAAPDDYRDRFADASSGEALGLLNVNGSKTGTLEVASDSDVFQVSLTAGVTYTFRMQGGPSGNGSLSTFSLGLYGANTAGSPLLGDSTAQNGQEAFFTYTATRSGVFFLAAASANGGNAGSYLVSASAPQDDYRNTYNGTGTLGSVATTGTARFGTLEKAGDTDVFAVTLTAGTSYTFDLGTSTNGTGLPDTMLRLLNGTGGVLLANNNYNGTNSHVVYTATAGGTYYLEAGSGKAGGTGSYYLTARANIDDYRGTYNGTGTVGSLTTSGTVRNGVLEKAGDIDLFAVMLTAGTTYTFDLTRTANGSFALTDTMLRLLNGTGTVVLSNDNFNSVNSHIVFTATTSGTYYLQTSSSITGGTGGYSITAGINLDDYRGTYNGTGTLSTLVTTGTVRSGVLERAGDVDVFAVTLTAGTSYTFDLLRTANGSFAMADTVLRLLNGTGGVLFTNNNYDSTNSHIVFTATTGGTYYLEATSGLTGGTGGYGIQARANFDDYRGTYNGAGALGSVATTGVAKSGVLERAGDVDVFAVTLTAGTSYTFDLASSSNASVALSDTMLRLLSGTGGVLLSNNNYNGTNSHIVYTATAGGTYYLEASSAITGRTGGYAVTARANFDDLADSIIDKASPLGTVAVGGSRMGTIEVAGDEDVFRFTLEAGHSYRMTAAGGTAAGMLSDAELHLFNSGGTLLAYNDDASAASLNAAIDFTATADGIHYLDVGGVKNAAGAYTLSIFDIT